MFPFLTSTTLREAPRTHLHDYKPCFMVSGQDSFFHFIILIYCDLLFCFSLLHLTSCTAGEVPFNHEILREANALCHRLPVLSTTKFKTDFYDVSKLYLVSPPKWSMSLIHNAVLSLSCQLWKGSRLALLFIFLYDQQSHDKANEEH